MKHVRLGDLATYVNGFAFKPSDWGSYGLPIVRIQDLTGNSYQKNFYSGEYPEKIEINNGDILISWSASLGVYKWFKGKALLNQHIFKVVFNKIDVDKEYFVYAVKFNLEKMKTKVHGATMKHIVKKDFDNIMIPLVNKNIQVDIAYKLSILERVIDNKKKQIILLDQLVKSKFTFMIIRKVMNFFVYI